MFWRGLAGYLPANIVQGLVGLGTIVVFTRLLTPAQFGDYALGFSVMALVHTATFTWNEAALARFQVAADERGDGAHHLRTVYGAWLALLAPLAICAGVALALPLRPELKIAVLAGLAAVLPRSLAKLAQERRRALGQAQASAGLDMMQTLGGFAVGAGLARAGLGGAAPLLGLGAGAALAAVAASAGDLRALRGGRFDAPRLKTHAVYGGPVAISLIFALALASLDRLLLGAFLDAEAVGAYHAGYSLANRTLDVAFIWLGAAGGPALVAALERGGPGSLAQAARDQAALMLTLTLPAAAGLALVARPLSELMIGEALRGQAQAVTPWIALSGLCAGLTTYYFHQAFTLGRRTGMLLTAMALPAAANLALNLALIPRFGLPGALWATAASYALGLVASTWLGRRALALPIPWTAAGQALAATALMAAAVMALPSPGGLVELALKASVGGAVYATAAAALDIGGLRTALQHALRRRVGAPA